MFETRLLTRQVVVPGTFEIELSRPEGFAFTAGQRIRLIHGALERDYSLTSSPADRTVRFCFREVKGGEFTPFLSSSEPGTRFRFTGPHGYFVFRTSGHPAVFVATGTGVGPFVSMAASGIRSFTLLHGARHERELAYESLLRKAAGQYVPCISGASHSRETGAIYPGRVTEYLQQELSRGEPYDFYLCGRGEMIRDATLLIDEAFPGSRIFTEIFF